MRRHLRAEWAKLTSLRAVAVLAAAGLLFSVLNAVATVALAGRRGSAPLGDPGVLAHVLRAGGVANWVVLLLAITVTAGEYQYRTITTSLLVTPRRHRLVAAKLVVLSIVGGLYAGASLLGSLAVALPAIAGRGIDVPWTDPAVAGVAVGVVATGVLHGAAGVAIGALARHTTLAAVGAIAWLVVAENIAGTVIGWRVVRYLPGQTAAAAAGVGDGRLLPMAAGGALFAGYVVVAAGLAGLLTVRRDVT